MNPTSSLSEDLARLSVGDRDLFSDDAHTGDASTSIPSSSEPDDRTEVSEEEKEFDADILDFFHHSLAHDEEPLLHCLLATVSSTDKNLLTLTPREAKPLVPPESTTETILRSAWAKRSFTKVRELEILQPVKRDHSRAFHIPNEQLDDESVTLQRKATESSWNRTYIGDASEELWRHIRNAFTESHPEIYAYYLAIVQSSGMGKSRTSDELSKKHIVIPMNLRDGSSTGYPPADHDVRNYLCAENSDPTVVNDRASAFLAALFFVTEQVLEISVPKPKGFRQLKITGDIPSQFRDYMAADMNMVAHGEFRREFYKMVVNRAESVEYEACRKYRERQAEINAPSTKRMRTPQDTDEFPPIAVFNRLVRLIREGDKVDTPTQGSQKRTRSANKETERTLLDDDPLIILVFDEAHTMTMKPSGPDVGWSNFSELRRALQHMKIKSLFSLFLSTTGKINQFVPSPLNDDSARIVRGELRLIQPFTDLGFDQLAKKISFDNDLTIEHITSDDYIAHFGRPMFGSRFDFKEEEITSKIVQFAAMKLIGEPYGAKSVLTNDQKLACLAQRLPIEFHSTTYTDQSKEMKQVEGHLRVCLRVDPGFESMTTVSASEPLLSEAAYWVMSNETFKPVEALKQVLSGFSVHKGDRRELVAMMLMTQARDSAVGRPTRLGKPKSRWVFVKKLFECLFREPAQVHCDVLKAKGQIFSPQGLSDTEKDFRAQFADSKFYFNHWVKLHQFGVLDIKYLLALYCRGAAALCANSQSGVDGLMPFLLEGTQIDLNNVGVCLWQAKNDSSYTDDPDEELFQRMDPFSLKIFKDNTTADVKIIRIVFAFASKKPSLKIVNVRSSTDKSYTTYDIWCSGLSPDILVPVEGFNEAWNALLQASYGWNDIYSGKGVPQGLRRSMNPGAALGKDHWSRWTKDDLFSE